MTHPDARDALSLTQAAADRAVHLLLKPSPLALDECLRQLELGHAYIQSSAADLCNADKASREQARAALEATRQSLGRVRRLLDHAAGFYSGWVRLRDTLVGGYSAGGRPAEMVAPGRLSVEG